MKNNKWPDLPLSSWEDTHDLLHLLSQIVGKIKLQFVPFKNHWWNISFHNSVRGLSTGIIPCGEQCFEMDFDMVDHKINIRHDNGQADSVELKSGTLSSYYDSICGTLKKSGIAVNLWPVPVEMEYRTPFNKDDLFRKYDPDSVQKFRDILVKVTKVMERFRGCFTGKASPVHFFWGAFDMAVTFFSGMPAPEHPGVPNVGKHVMKEAYNAQLTSFGFWPGKGLGEPAFYSYTYPQPDGYKDYGIEPAQAYYHEELGEYVLPYREVADSENPEETLFSFFRSAYKAAEKLENWNTKLFRC